MTACMSWLVFGAKAIRLKVELTSCELRSDAAVDANLQHTAQQEFAAGF